MAAEDFYSTLGVARGAQPDEIKKAYKKLAKELHPDKNQGNKATETRFKAVNRAYDALHDPKKRKLYDEFGEEALREGFDEAKTRAYKQYQSRPQGGGGFGGGRVSMEDLFGGNVGGGGRVDVDAFSDLFGRQGGGRRRGPVRGQDVEQELTVDFTSAVKGTSVQLRHPGGGDPVTVRIPPGANEGARVRIAGQGGASPNGGASGDLILVIHVEPHEHFVRDGDDLTLEVPITMSEAMAGAKVKVPTFDGSVTVKVPPGTSSGTKLRLRGKGVVRKGREPGDLYVRFMVVVPVASEELTKLAEQVAKLETGDPRANLVA